MEEKARVENDIIKLDFSTLRDTTFYRCKLVFEGGRPPSMVNCDFIECEFILDGPARNTQAFLTILSQIGAADLVVKGMLGLKNWSENHG